jgi:hypothetical protein
VAPSWPLVIASVNRDAHRGFVLEAAPSATFEMAEPDLLLVFLIVAFDAPAQFGNINKRCKLDVCRQGREPVFGRLLVDALDPAILA